MPAFLNRKKKPSSIWPKSPALRESAVQRIQKDPRLGPKVKMLAIAAGGSATELGYVRQEFPIPFPIIRDTQYEIHKLLGEPRTPFTLLIDRKGKALFTHLGVIEDMESFFNKIAVLVP